MVMGDKAVNDSGKILAESLNGYRGYFEIEARALSASAFIDGAHNKLSPISIYAEQIATRFGKVRRADYLKIFSEMKNYVNVFSDKFHLTNNDPEFFSTRFLSGPDSDKISDVELDLLSKLDEIVILIRKESNHEFLQEIEVAIPKLNQMFDEITALFEQRAALIKKFSGRHNEINSTIKDFDDRLKNINHNTSISEMLKTIEQSHENLPVIYVALMEVFSTNLTTFKKLSDHVEEYELAVEYFSEFDRITNNAKISYSKGTLLPSDRNKIKDIIKSSGNLSDIIKTIKSNKAGADLKEGAERKKKKLIKFLLIIGGILLAGAGAAYYLLNYYQ